MGAKAKRLSKVARELNVGTSTIVEFLKGKGIEIDSNPNTKVLPEHFEMLSEEFAADQSLREKVEAKKDLPKRERRESISIESVKAKEEEKVQEEQEVQKEHEVQVEHEAQEEQEKVVEEKLIEVVKEIEVESPEEESTPEVIAETPDASIVAPQEEAEEKVSEETSSIGPKIIGKLDLSSIDSSTRPKKSKKGSGEKPKGVKQPTPPEKKPEKKPTEVVEAKTKPKEDAPELIRAHSEELAGVKVVGKIELPTPVERKKKDKKGINNKDDLKRKRKRIKKVNIDSHSHKQQKGKGKKKEEVKTEITQEDIDREIKETLARLNQKGKTRAVKNRREKRRDIAERRERELEQEKLEELILKLTEFVSVSELASMMNVQATEVISACMSLGIFASINQRLDAETIQIVADEFGFEVEFVSADVQDAVLEEEDNPEDLEARPPIITVMGHVDHGKTSLLDYIRHAKTAEDEAGGITQHIGAYSVNLKDRKLTFLDTPGHEAFTAMRARGAQVTDVAIIIIAADDQVMPQTKEAIAHAQAADVPMVFAINKIDKPGANTDKIREQLSEMNILVEEWGGKFQCQEISAKKGVNIDELLEKVLLEADLMELKANPSKNAVGTVLESSLDKGKGYVTNMLVEAGTLKVGDIVLAGQFTGRVRAMHNSKGLKIEKAGPSTPISILGISGAPSAGDRFFVMNDEREARDIASRREQLAREQGLRTQKHITLDEIGRRLAIGDFQELNVIVKGDVDGSIEALSDSLQKLSTEEIQLNIVHKAVGAITETDVNLASASDAIIVGFQVRPTGPAKKLADDEQIDIRLYSVIYKAIEEIKSAMEGMLSPDIKEEIVGTAEVRETFHISKVGTIAGCYVTSGIIQRKSLIRIIRDGIVIHEGTLGSLKRFKDDVKEVKNNYECGLNINGFNDVQVEDIIEAYEEVEVARKLK